MSVKRREFLKSGALAPLLLGSSELRGQDSRDPIDELTDLTSLVPATPVKDHLARIERARKLLYGQGAGALYVESGSTLFYYSGVRWGRSERMFALVIPRSGPPAFICPAFEEERAREQIQFKDADIRIWQEHESPYQRVVEVLQDRQVSTAPLAVDPTVRTFLVLGIRRAAPPLEIGDGAPVSEGCRRVKTRREVEYMRLANIITKKAYAAALQRLEKGMTERDLAGRISRAHGKMGARGGAMVLFGPHSALPHGSRKVRELQEGDVVLIDGGCGVHGYRSDVTRTTVFGEPTEKQKKVWDLVRKAQAAALEVAGPGKTCQDLDRTARKVIEEGGFGPGYQYFTHRLGHGIGLDGHEVPYLVEGNTLVLERGMSFSNEPGIYIPGEWGVRHEDIMVITEDGAEFLGEATGDILNPV